MSTLRPAGASRIVPDEVREGDRVLDMGTGSGVNGIVAASGSREVLAVDVNPAAVACASDNAERNGVADRVEVRESDLFQNTPGRFDLIIFDPPFRWFRPRDMYERGTADENYRTLTTFFDQASDHLGTGVVASCSRSARPATSTTCTTSSRPHVDSPRPSFASSRGRRTASPLPISHTV